MPKDRSKDEPWSVEDTGMAKARIGDKTASSKFDPYQGAAAKPRSRKRDLRQVQEWLEAKRRAAALKHEDSGED
jgi:hypothetical protein